MRVVVVLVLLAGCWRNGAVTEGALPTSRQDPVSFVVRVNGLAELQRSTSTLEPKLATALRRILALASEAQRTTLRHDLGEIGREIAQLAARARAARERGDDPVAVERVQRKLSDAVATLAKLRTGLRYASSIEQLHALDNRPTEQPVPPAWDINDRIDIVMSPAHDPNRWRRGHVLDFP
jgi:hypothetical protein